MRENRHRPNNSNFYSERSERNYENSPAISELAKKEQEHRHQWQDKYLRTNAVSFRMGQVFGLVYNLALLWMVYDLIQDGEKSLALKIFVGNLAIIAFALLVTSIERKVLSRKPPRRHGRGQKFNRDRKGGRDNRDNRENRDRDQKRF